MLARRVRREDSLSGRPYMWLIVLSAERDVNVDVVESQEVNGVSQTKTRSLESCRTSRDFPH